MPLLEAPSIPYHAALLGAQMDDNSSPTRTHTFSAFLKKSPFFKTFRAFFPLPHSPFAEDLIGEEVRAEF